MYHTPCCSSATINPFRIISVSIEDEEPFQFLKQVCSGVLLYWTQAAQNLLRTPMYKIFSVFKPKITPTSQRALYECLCVRLLHPASTITDIAGTPWWYLFSCIASSRSALPAACIDSSSSFHHHFPIIRQVLTNTLLDITGTPSTLMDSSSLLKPPPVAICPHMAARLQLQYFFAFW